MHYTITYGVCIKIDLNTSELEVSVFSLRNTKDSRTIYLNKLAGISRWMPGRMSYNKVFSNNFIHTTIIFDFLDAIRARYTSRLYEKNLKRILAMAFIKSISIIIGIIMGFKYFIIDSLQNKFDYLKEN